MRVVGVGEGLSGVVVSISHAAVGDSRLAEDVPVSQAVETRHLTPGAEKGKAVRCSADPTILYEL